MAALQHGHADVVEALLEHGAKINLDQDAGFAVLMQAIVEGQAKVVQALLQYSSHGKTKNTQGERALRTALNHCEPEIIEMILNLNINMRNDLRAEGGALVNSFRDIQNYGLIEVLGNDTDEALCSDDSCPCGYPGETIPRGSGYIFISKEVAEFRKQFPSQSQAVEAIKFLTQQQYSEIGLGTIVLPRSGQFGPVIMCRRGARRRKLDLLVAAADAKLWWKMGILPCRKTPKRRWWDLSNRRW